MCNSRRTENLSAPFDDSDGVFVPSCPPIAGTMKHACGLCILRSAVSINWDDVIRKGYCPKWICMLPGRLFSRECLTCSKWLAAAFISLFALNFGASIFLVYYPTSANTEFAISWHVTYLFGNYQCILCLVVQSFDT